MIHLVEELRLDAPLASYRRAFTRDTFVLDGGSFGFFGADPIATFRAWRSSRRRDDGALAARIAISNRDGHVHAQVDDAFAALRALLAEHAFEPVSRPMPLLAGAVGYVAYEAGQMLERLPCTPRPSIGMPDIAFAFHRWIIGRSRESGRAWLSTIGTTRAEAEVTRDSVLRAISSIARELPNTRRDRGSIDLRASLSKTDYVARIDDAKAHIFAGDAFEICLTNAFDAPFAGDPWALFAELRDENPAPFAAILDLPEGAIVSSSPERFVRLDAARVAESRPIKGTRPRGATPEGDASLAEELATSSKDRAENAMIVDLVRNDLGKVCRFGSVTAPEVFAVESYATVHQLVSTIRGELDDERDAIDLVRACFPPGSMTGAPKIEATSILERLEPKERGVYAGALGYLDFSGPIDLSVVIRAIVVRGGRAHLQTGGAIVADSEPATEHDETLHKLRALVAALEATP